jgi:PadR family transcriptional regulator, regulatory protein AphA
MSRDNTSLYVVLGIMSFNPVSGYNIKKRVEKDIGYFYKISNGQIYPILKKIIESDMATFVTEKNEGKPDSKIYTITEKGLETLKTWLSTPVNFENPNGNEFLVRLYLGPLITMEENIAMLDNFKQMKLHYLNIFNKVYENFNLGTIKRQRGYFSYFTLRYGQILAQANIDWVNETVGVLENLKEDKKI